jgi:hypothetical protein
MDGLRPFAKYATPDIRQKGFSSNVENIYPLQGSWRDATPPYTEHTYKGRYGIYGDPLPAMWDTQVTDPVFFGFAESVLWVVIDEDISFFGVPPDTLILHGESKGDFSDWPSCTAVAYIRTSLVP